MRIPIITMQDDERKCPDCKRDWYKLRIPSHSRRVRCPDCAKKRKQDQDKKRMIITRKKATLYKNIDVMGSNELTKLLEVIKSKDPFTASFFPSTPSYTDTDLSWLPQRSVKKKDYSALLTENDVREIVRNELSNLIKESKNNYNRR